MREACLGVLNFNGTSPQIEETTKGLRGKLETLAGNEESGRLSLAVLQVHTVSPNSCIWRHRLL
jgi:hypothetical protein